MEQEEFLSALRQAFRRQDALIPYTMVLLRFFLHIINTTNYNEIIDEIHRMQCIVSEIEPRMIVISNYAQKLIIPLIAALIFVSSTTESVKSIIKHAGETHRVADY